MMVGADVALIRADLARRLAHEIRSPMSVIVGALGQLGNDADSQSRELLLQLGQRSCQRLERVVRRLDALADLVDDSRPRGPDAAAKAADVLGRTAEQVAREGGRARIEVGVDTRQVVSPAVQLSGAVARGLEAGVGELLHNAVKYARNRVRMVAAVRDGRLSVKIEDDGRGLDYEPPDPALFEPRPGHGSGLGVGLWLAQQCLAACGGSIALTTGPHGTTAAVTVPTRTSTDQARDE